MMKNCTYSFPKTQEQTINQIIHKTHPVWPTRTWPTIEMNHHSGVVDHRKLVECALLNIKLALPSSTISSSKLSCKNKLLFIWRNYTIMPRCLSMLCKTRWRYITFGYLHGLAWGANQCLWHLNNFLDWKKCTPIEIIQCSLWNKQL